MRLSATAAVQNGAFSDFLAAEIGEEKNGMALSLLSALTRLGIDPWQEASRLAELPEKKAVDALSAIIARAVTPAPADTDTPSLAERLVRLLPRPGTQRPAPPRPRDAAQSWTSVFAGVQLPPPATLRWWAIAATVAIALIANLLW
jgi:hypothetical protein